MTTITTTKPLSDTLQSALETAAVSVSGYFYCVDLGPGVRPQFHRVGKDRRCSCDLGSRCPAVSMVTEYLRAGGERAPDPPPGFYPVAPATCPICGAAAVFDGKLSSRRRGAGWRCVNGGKAHYWQAHVQVTAEKFAANPWLFPPVVLRDGKRLVTHAGVKPGDQVLYAGVLRADT